MYRGKSGDAHFFFLQVIYDRTVAHVGFIETFTQLFYLWLLLYNMRFLGAAVSAILAVRGVVALPAADAAVTDDGITDNTTADASSDDLVASSTDSYGIKPKVVIISHVSKASYIHLSAR